MAVHPQHQRQGLGSRLMDAVMGYIAAEVPETAYVNLMADVDGFYEQSREHSSRVPIRTHAF